MKDDLERYLRYLEHRHPKRSTKKHYASDLNIFLQIVENKSPREITVRDINDFLENQSQRQLKPSTINRRLVAISRFFQFLIVEAEEGTDLKSSKLLGGALRVFPRGTHNPVISGKGGRYTWWTVTGVQFSVSLTISPSARVIVRGTRRARSPS